MGQFGNIWVTAFLRHNGWMVEYKDAPGAPLEDELKKLGENGWELVSVVPVAFSTGGYSRATETKLHLDIYVTNWALSHESRCEELIIFFKRPAEAGSGDIKDSG